MIQRDITFKDLDGKDVTESYYFALSKLEIFNIYAEDREFFSTIESIRENPDPLTIVRSSVRLLMMSVGRRSEDGRRLIKSPEITSEFSQSAALETIAFDLLMDSDFAVKFFNDLLPSDISETVEKMRAANGMDETSDEPISGKVLSAVEVPVTEPTSDVPAWLSELREPSKRELGQMSTDEIALAMRMKQAGQLK